MAVDRVADMSVNELRSFINEVVNERLKHQNLQREDKRSLEEVLAAMDRLRWTPPLGTPTTLEMIRDDRDV